MAAKANEVAVLTKPYEERGQTERESKISISFACPRWLFWQNFINNTGAALTTWNYDPARGWLISKRDNSNKGVDYTYTPGGRLATRKKARQGIGGANLITTYTYGFQSPSEGNYFPEIRFTEPQNDPGNSWFTLFGYDRRGRKISEQQTGGVSYTYHDSGQVLSETYFSGILAGINLQYTLDSMLRRSSVTVRNGTTVLASTTYTFDPASRLASVSDGTYSAQYVYLANSSLVGQVHYKHGSTTRMTTSRTFDLLNRLGSISHVPTGSSALSFAYQYNSANQRTRVNLADGSYWLYEYDNLGQVKSGKRYWVDHMPVPGQQFEYGFDDIGNRLTSKNGGDAAGSGLRTSTYTPNLLNQYTQRTVPGGLDVIGLANAGQSVTVNSSVADYRRGESELSLTEAMRNEERESQLRVTGISAGKSFRFPWCRSRRAARLEKFSRRGAELAEKKISVSASLDLCGKIIPHVTTTGGGSANGNVFVPKTSELLTYDDDGNTLSDGRWDYVWDAENRLTTLIARNPVGEPSKTEFQYDAQGRRIQKSVWNTTSPPSGPVLIRRYVYDGWNLVAELEANLTLVQSYLWGTDLSGSLQGAGGVGGLIAIRPASGPARFTAFDGNGNVIALVNASNGSIDARYEYGPFGENIRTSGSFSKTNPFRFSTKYQDDETDFLYYGYRYYDVRNGRWVNRDPIGEEGGMNLYGFVGNEPISRFDLLGLDYGNAGRAAGFREKAACVIDCGIAKSKKAAEIAGQAAAAAMRRFPNSSLHNDEGDAWRHCYWSCEMSRTLGWLCAAQIAKNHKDANDRAGAPPEERKMDDANNSRGRFASTDIGNCAYLCAVDLDEGKLIVLKPSRP